MSIFNFTEEDLRENQRGLISPRQKEWLQATARSARHSERRDTLFMAGVVFLILCVILVLVLQNESARAVILSTHGILVIIFVLTVLALAIFLNYRDVNRLEDSVLSSVSGVVHLDESSDEYNNPIHFVFVGTKRFIVGEGMSATFKDKEGEKYKVYYCESGLYQRVMSYEQLT